MALEGMLDAFGLADVLRLLAATCKSGWLVVDGDRSRGHLQIADGELVAAATAGMPDTAPL